MDKNKLGLPLEYSELSEYFDSPTTSEQENTQNRIVQKLLHKYGAERVLDLTCGTGAQVFYLTKLGFSVTGADFSPKLLEIARKKAKNANLDLKFIDGDMRTLQVGQFDAVITIFNAIGHVTKDDFGKTLTNIYNNLKPGGIYVFDIFNLEAMTPEAVQNFAMSVNKKVGNTNMQSTQYSTLDRALGQLTSYDSYTIENEKHGTRKLKNKFTLQVYTALELQEILFKHGFDTLEQVALDGSKLHPRTSTNIVTVARKRLNALYMSEIW